MDVFEYLAQVNGTPFKTILYDPPYSHPMAVEYAQKYKLDKNKVYCYSYFHHPEKTKLLHRTLRRLAPDTIIVKCWTVPPLGPLGYHLNDGISCWSGGLRPLTYTLIFKLRQVMLQMCQLVPNGN